MADDTADMRVFSIDGTDIITFSDEALSAVAYSSDYTAAVACTVDISAVPTSDKVCAVAPVCDTSEELSVILCFTYLTAGNVDIFNNGV